MLRVHLGMFGVPWVILANIVFDSGLVYIRSTFRYNESTFG